MSRSIKRNITLLSCMLLFVFGAFAQSKEDLQAKKDQIQKDILYKNKLLEQTQKQAQRSVQEVVLLEKKIGDRERYIRTINREVRLITKQIEETKNEITRKEEELQSLKDEYAKMIYYAYKNKSSYDKLMFVFSADNFNQAYKRLMYYQEYARYREQQVEMIKKTQQELLDEIEKLKQQRQEKKDLLNHEREERNVLAEERKEKQNVVIALQDDEKKLKAEIKKKQKEKKKLEDAILKMIEEEIRRNEALSKEGAIISQNFTENKGKLPWPVENGEITGRYGKQSHPILKGIEIQNNGIDISTTPGAVARAVFDGEVTKVMIIPGVGKVVMVRHGDYYTVYSNLKETFVQKGDKVTTKQEIGTIVTDESKGVTEVHFEIWQKQNIMNPTHWIYKAK